MAKVLVSETYLTNIANAIRQKNGGSSQYTPAQMADAISAIQVGGSGSQWEVNITQSANQTISVQSSISKTGTSSYVLGESTDVPTVLATVTPSTGYNAGTASVQRSGNTFSVSASAATLKTYTVTIEQTSHQTITVTCNGTPHTTSFTASHGSTWTATIVADEGYTAGSLYYSSGTLTDNITISATLATGDSPIFGVTFVQPATYEHFNDLDQFVYAVYGYLENDVIPEITDDGGETEVTGSPLLQNYPIDILRYQPQVTDMFYSYHDGAFFIKTDISLLEDNNEFYGYTEDELEAMFFVFFYCYVTIIEVSGLQEEILVQNANAGDETLVNSNYNLSFDYVSIPLTDNPEYTPSGSGVYMVVFSDEPITQQQIEDFIVSLWGD